MTRFTRILVGFFLIVAAGLSGCLMSGRGGGTETESNLEGRAVNPDGSPAVGARVTLRSSDYLADPVSSPEEDDQRRETSTDAQGRFRFLTLPINDYRVEIAGTESGGFIRDVSLPAAGNSVILPVDTLHPRGGIKGEFAPDSEAQLSRFVQVFGMERLVKADPSGSFVIGNLPAGKYDIRCSSLQPFRRDALLKSVVVESGKITNVDQVSLVKEAKLAFHVGADGLTIEGMDSTGPVILDNEIWNNGIENEFIWAKASLGSISLRGNIVTQSMGPSPRTTQAEQMGICREELRSAQLAGLTKLLDPTAGALTRLVLPASGKWEDLIATPSAGSDLIVAEARKATPEKPLIIVVGGPLTTVAQAYLTDPTIASRMVVAGIYSFTSSSYDTVANYLVSTRCRFLQWGRTYSWSVADVSLDTARLGQIPATRMGDDIRDGLYGGRPRLVFSDLAPFVYLFDKRVWKNADMVKVSSRLIVQPASDITFDFLDIPASANDWQRYQDEFFATMNDPGLYPAHALPAALEAEAYYGHNGTSEILVDASTGNLGISYSPGNWTEYRVSAGAPAKFTFAVRYRSATGGRLAVGLIGKPALSEFNVPATSSWSEAQSDSVALGVGESEVWIRAVNGKIDLDQLEIR